MSHQVFDVVQYGAVGDGVADDYPAITAAYDALVAASCGFRPTGTITCARPAFTACTSSSKVT